MEAPRRLLLSLKKGTPGLRFTLGVSTFVPKAHTPFQWQGVRPEAEKRLKLLAKRLKPKGIDLRPESYGWSVIQALLSRSDRRLAPVIAAVRGSQESLGGWKKAYRAALWPVNSLKPAAQALSYRCRPSWHAWCTNDGPLTRCCPGAISDGPLSQEKLQEHRQQALSLGDRCRLGLPNPTEGSPANRIQPAMLRRLSKNGISVP